MATAQSGMNRPEITESKFIMEYYLYETMIVIVETMETAKSRALIARSSLYIIHTNQLNGNVASSSTLLDFQKMTIYKRSLSQEVNFLCKNFLRIFCS